MSKVVFCTPSLNGPTAPYVDSLTASIPLIKEAGWEEGYAQELQNPYISAARMMMTRKALTAGADVVIYLDYDLSWDPKDLLTLLEAEGDVVGGTYRFKKEEEQYMGQLVSDKDGFPVRRADGCLQSSLVPAGFLKVTKKGLTIFAKSYPELVCGDVFAPDIDLFNHGARDGIWWGEDYSFCERWCRAGGEIWTPPDINLHHHGGDQVFKGNLHKFLLRQEGGINHQEVTS